MTVIITFAGISGGDSLSDTIDITNGTTMSPGDASDIQDIFIRHDAEVAPITNCAFYLTQFAGSSYPGDDAGEDFLEIISWGDSIVDKGAKISQVVPGSWTAPTPFDFAANGQTFESLNGSINSPYDLAATAIVQGTAETGKIYVGGEAHIQFKVDTPIESLITRPAGYRAVSLVFAYSATS